MDGNLRPLVGGASDTEGIVEVCFNGIFRPLHLEFRGEDSNNMATIREASVICKQLGLGNGMSVVTYPYYLLLLMNIFSCFK